MDLSGMLADMPYIANCNEKPLEEQGRRNGKRSKQSKGASQA